MKIINMGGFNPEEQIEFTPIIHSNVYESVQAIYQASHQLNIELSPDIVEIAQEFNEPFSKLLTPGMGAKIHQFWKDETVLEILERRNEFQILDNTRYFSSHITRICEKGYVPSEMDILQSRAQTTGVTETIFNINQKKFVFIDVGGQRSERKKWLHVFENVTGVIFCVAISAFDQTLFEDHYTNRSTEALTLFRDISTSKWFTNTVIILFFNKSDIFKEKLAQGKSISAAFPEFKGGSDYDSSLVFLKGKFRTDLYDTVTGAQKTIYCHVTNATDTDNVRFVWDSVRDFALTTSLKKAGFM